MKPAIVVTALCVGLVTACELEVEPAGAEGGVAAQEAPGVVPDTDYCAAAGSWDAAWADYEVEVLQLVNQARAEGGSCGHEGSFEPSAPLAMNPVLRCAARLHALDMADSSYFSHTSEDGRSPYDRMSDAGYEFSWAGENIAAGQPGPAEVVEAWLDSPSHCMNVLDGQFVDLGVGYVGGGRYGHYWAQSFGAP